MKLLCILVGIIVVSGMEVDVSADEEKSIAERVDGLKTIFKSEFVAGGKEKYFIAPDEDSSPAEDPVKSATDDQFFNAFNTLNLTSDEYQEMINDFCARISKKEGDYQTKVETYRNTRRSGQDSSIATYSDVGANCQMQEVSLLATECQSRVSSVDGPARQRYLAKQPRVKIRGLSEVETQVVQTNHREKELWNRIL